MRSALDVETRFKQGVDLFNARRYDEALTTFEGLLEGDYRHQRLTAVLYMRARCAYQLGRYEAARTTLEELEKGFPKSNYVQYGHALLGMIAFQKEAYLEAAVEFLWVIETSRNPALRNQATEWARTVLEDYLSLNDLRRLRKDYAGPKGTPLVILALAREEMALGHREAGEKLIDEFLRANPEAPIRAELEQLRRANGEPVLTTCRIGIILPLTGVDAKAGMGVYRGLKYAQLIDAASDHYGAGPVPAVEFIVRDSESSLVHALKEAQALLDDPGVVAIIGEVDNSVTGALAALANAKGVPLLAPVATENGIGTLGENVFQLNADRERKSRALAEYAYNYLHARTFVTLAPQDNYGQQMTDGFSAAVDSLGGEILAQKWYYDQPQDLSRLFKAIRKAALRKAGQDSLLRIESRTDHDEFNVPVTNINAIFLPLHEEDIQLVARQWAYYNLQSVILGGENWYTADIAKSKELQRYVEGAIFASDYFIDPENTRYKQFRNDFRKRMGTTPEKWELFGYDTANLLFKVIQQGARTRHQIRQALSTLDGFIGLRGEISLNNPEKVNSKVNILQIRGAQVVKLR
ncbi:MAG: penicillin-binding protein activator [candidate division KSB1 bacterium]|nr:penicillin-binding protein activator [candidate division KSB1 bacterium]MDZ7310853.1 penicillin-binding protein activator [candidate division KSB1 bacterium]